MAWRGSTQAWSGKARAPDLKIQYPTNTADVVMLSEPEMRNFGTRPDGSPDDRYYIKIGYLGGNALAGMYNKEEKKKYEVPAEIGDIYTLWMGKSLIQAIVNIWPDEDEPMVGKVIKVGRVKVTGGRFGGFLGYTAEEISVYNTGLVDRLFEKLTGEEAAAELDEPAAGDTGSEDLEIAFQLVSTSLQALSSMSYAQMDNFLKSRKSAGLMKIDLSAQEVANYCVTKDPTKFEIVAEGDTRSLVLK